jgi:S-adenosylmethionine decarboxylase
MKTLEPIVCHGEIIHEASGYHFLMRLSECSSELLNDEEALRTLVQNAALATGATVLQIISRRFEPQGITVLAMLAESHASLHTYPESNVVFWDCFTCGKTCKPELSAAILEESLKPASVHRQLIVRD